MFRVETAGALHVAADLVYTTGASCRVITELPSASDALAKRLLPEKAAFRGNMQLAKAASGDGCALYLTLKGAVATAATDSQDAFDVARQVHAQLTQLLDDEGLKNVALARAAVALDGDKLLAVSMQSKDAKAAAESVLTVQRGVCTQLLQTLESGDGGELLPSQVETGKLDVAKQEDVDETADCAVILEVAAGARVEKEEDVFKLLKNVDEKLETFFAGQEGATLESFNVRLQVTTSESEALGVQMESVSASPKSNVTYNAPSYEEALGIFALLAVLVAMMLGVVVQKKRNDKRCRERYDRASRAAQIRRVSIRMSHYDQDEYEGEKDSLL